MINRNIISMKNLKSISLLAGFSCLFLSTLNVNPAEASRRYYTKTFTRHFDGVASCGKYSRQNQEARLAVKEYLKSRSLPAYTKSWKIIRRWSHQRKTTFGKRKCSGFVKVQLRYYTRSRRVRRCRVYNHPHSRHNCRRYYKSF